MTQDLQKLHSAIWDAIWTFEKACEENKKEILQNFINKFPSGIEHRVYVRQWDIYGCFKNPDKYNRTEIYVSSDSITWKKW